MTLELHSGLEVAAILSKLKVTPAFEDPLDADSPGDEVVVTSRRRLLRLALVSSEAGARFQRDGLSHDPLAWMLTPRTMFNGATAMDACMDKAPCLRAYLLHRLSLGLDARPEELDLLIIEGEDDEGVDKVPDAIVYGGWGERAGRRLFTSVFVEESETATVHAFCATMATSHFEARAALGRRHGPRPAESAHLFDGFDPSAPLVSALVSDAMADMLIQIAADPTSPLADGLDVAIEQRFVA